jgi:flagellar motor switch protein FliM
LHEVLARNLTNSLDVYLGTGLEVRLIDVQQLTMEEFRNQAGLSGYMLPCIAKPSASTVLIELDNSLMFTMVDLLLGGPGASPEESRELTEIDEEIMEGVGSLIAGQMERVWQPLGYTLTAGKCVKPNLAHKAFPPTEKILRIHLDVSLAGVSGGLHIAFQASLGGHLVRNSRTDAANNRHRAKYLNLPKLEKRILDCEFSLSGEIPELKVSVRDLARLDVGVVLTLAAPAAAPGKLTLEGRHYFEASPVGRGNHKAMQLLSPILLDPIDFNHSEDEKDASS